MSNSAIGKIFGNIHFYACLLIIVYLLTKVGV